MFNDPAVQFLLFFVALFVVVLFFNFCLSVSTIVDELRLLNDLISQRLPAVKKEEESAVIPIAEFVPNGFGYTPVAGFNSGAAVNIAYGPINSGVSGTTGPMQTLSPMAHVNPAFR